MARYYFDLLDRDGLVVDAEGREIEGLHNVQIEAARSLIDLARGLSDGDCTPCCRATVDPGKR